MLGIKMHPLNPILKVDSGQPYLNGDLQNVEAGMEVEEAVGGNGCLRFVRLSIMLFLKI